PGITPESPSGSPGDPPSIPSGITNPNPTPVTATNPRGPESFTLSGTDRDGGSGAPEGPNRICRLCFHTWQGGPTCPRASEHRSRQARGPGAVGDAIPGALARMDG